MANGASIYYALSMITSEVKMNKRNSFQVAMLGLVVLLAACSPAQPAAPADAGQISADEEVATPEDSENVAAGVDLVLPDICELLPADEVASLSDGTLASEPQASDYGDDFKSCWYDFNLADGSYDYYIIYVQPAELLELVFEDNAEPVSGLGDRAQLKWEEDEEQFRLAVIEGNLGVEVIGKRSDVMEQLARLILERL
ncbi:MAG: hypothetical protein ACRDFQ_02215 [Anaerolineales bacterium]